MSVASVGRSQASVGAWRDIGRPTLADRTVTVMAAEFVAILVTAYASSFFYRIIVYGPNILDGANIFASFFLAACYILICLADNQYVLAGERWSRDGPMRAAVALCFTFSFFLSIVFIFDLHIYFSRGVFLLQFASTMISIFIMRIALAQWLERSIRLGYLRGREIIVISISRYQSTEFRSQLSTKLDQIMGWHDVKSLPKAGNAINKALARIRLDCRKMQPDLIVIVYDMDRKVDVERIIRAFYELPIQIRLLPIELIPFMGSGRVAETGGFKTLELSTYPQSLFGRFAKRALDLLGALAAVILFSPILILAALAIKIESPGPILFRQLRHGYNNEPIEVLKFRTMKTAKRQELFRQTSKRDSRVTGVGSLLRKTSIDELPQLFNVIRGDMSLVGPRPHATQHNEAFATRVPMIFRRHNVKPGITGWAQVNGLRGATDTCAQMQKRLDYDLYYIDNWSFFFDVKILILTIFSRKTFINAY